VHLKRKSMRWYLGVIIALSMGFAAYIGYAGGMRDLSAQIGSYCVYPLVQFHASVIKPYYDFCVSLQGYRELVRDHHTLQIAYNELQGSYIALKATTSYARDVEKELAWFKKRFEVHDAAVVPVMGMHRSDRQHTMLIEGGSTKGIEKDMVVLADNLLVGKVVTVYPWYAVVQLITDPASCVSVYGVGSSAHGIVRGTGSPDTLFLERVDHLSPVQEKELLLSSGDGLVVPRGYGVGVVETYNSDGLYYTGTVKIVHDISNLKTCLVVHRANLLKIS
jgi:rod shape-determining protein MreC